MRVFVPFEVSGKVRAAFKARGHDTWSCDLLEPDDNSNFHYQGDYRKFVKLGWDLMIAFPVCTAVCVSGNGTYADTEARKQGVRDFIEVYNQPILKKCLENPEGVISTKFKKPTQYIQPYEHGHKISKKTGLWLVGLPPIKPTKIVEPEWVYYHGNSGNRCSPDQYKNAFSKTRGKTRAETYQGIADAMAEQWG